MGQHSPSMAVSYAACLNVAFPIYVNLEFRAFPSAVEGWSARGIRLPLFLFWFFNIPHTKKKSQISLIYKKCSFFHITAQTAKGQTAHIFLFAIRVEVFLTLPMLSYHLTLGSRRTRSLLAGVPSLRNFSKMSEMLSDDTKNHMRNVIENV